MIDHLSVSPEDTGIELDEFLCRVFPLYTKRFLRRQVRAGRVLVDGVPASPSQRLRRDDVVSLDLDDDEAETAPPAAPDLSLEVLYEDEHVLVVDKPAALAVEPDRWDGTRPSLIGALHALAGNLDEGPGRFRPRLVHRLDKDTSGVVLVAKTVDAERALREAFDRQQVRKRYLALVEGEHPLPDGEEQLIDVPLAPDRRRSGVVVAVASGGKAARTRIGVEQRFRGYTLLRCMPLTGRTHQIRVHLRQLGFPLAVDPIYGRRKALYLSELKSGYRPKPGRVEQPLIDRLTLHAARLEFPAPVEPGRRVQVDAAPARDLQRVLKQLAKVRPLRARRN